MPDSVKQLILLIVVMCPSTLAVRENSVHILVDQQTHESHVSASEQRDSLSLHKRLESPEGSRATRKATNSADSGSSKQEHSSESIIAYSILSGEEFIPEIPPQLMSKPAACLSGHRPVSEQIDTLDSGPKDALNFSDPYLIEHPEEYPWSVTVYVDVCYPSGECGYGTGVLIDARHVITAGHLVYNPSEGGWATNFRVRPGYPYSPNPYGTAEATVLYSWTQWTDGGVIWDYDWDMGFVLLDRPIGALAGWHSFGYNDDNSFFQNNTFQNPGYPGEGPFEGNNQLYSRFGEFDLVSTNQVSFWKESYIGQSGGGAYTAVSGSYVVYATESNHIPFPPRTNFCRITASKFSDIVSTINSNTPSTFDLIPMDVRVTPNTQSDPPYIRAGDGLTSMDYVVHNNSSASFVGTITVDIYLSLDGFITPEDVLLQERQRAVSLGPKASQRFVVSDPLPNIPLDTPPYDYFIGAMLVVDDYNSSNNFTPYEDLARVRVLPPLPPDDAPTWITATDDHCLEVQVCWGNVPRETGYHVYRDGQLVGNTGANETCFDDAVSSGTYTYYVKAYNNGGEGPPSATDAGTSLNIPSQVQGLSASVGVCDKVYLFWNDVADEDGYHIYRNDEPIGGVEADVTNFLDLTGQPYVTYEYRVDAYNACTNGAASDPAYGFRSGPPEKVPGVNASDTFCDRVEISWSDVERETGYRVYRDGQQVGGDRPQNSTSYIYYPSACGTWQFTVRAVNSCGEGTASDPDAGTRLCSPSQVQGVVATDNLCGQVELNWEDVTGESGFRIERDGNEIDDVAANTVEYSDDVAAGAYTYAVKAYSSCGDGPESDGAPGASIGEIGQVQNVSATDDRFDGVLVLWDDLAGEQGYRIYRNGSVICETPEDVNGCLDQPEPGCYAYTVVAFNVCGEGTSAAPDSGCRLLSGEPQIVVSTDSITFVLPQGVHWNSGDWPYVDSIWIGNAGEGPLFPEANNENMPVETWACFVPPITAMGILPGGSALMVIEFRHEFYSGRCDGFFSTPGNFEGELAISSNDPSAPMVTIPILKQVPDPGLPSLEITHPTTGDSVICSPYVDVLADFFAFDCISPEIFGAASYGEDASPTDSVDWWPSPWSVRFYPSQSSDSCRLILCVKDLFGRGSCDTTGYFTVICAYSSSVWYVSVEGSDQSGSGTYENPYASIQMAINAAESGDTVMISAGHYSPFEVTKALVLQSLERGDSVVIDGTTGSRCAYIECQTDTVVLIGLTFHNGNTLNAPHSESGGGLLAVSSNVKVENCTFSGNYAASGGGGAFFTDDTYFEIINSVVSENSAAAVGGGIATYDSKGGRIDHCVIEGNYVEAGSGGLYFGRSAEYVPNVIAISNITVVNNSSSFLASGIQSQGCDVTLENSIVSANRGSYGPDGMYGVYASDCEFTILCCDLYDNDGNDVSANCQLDSFSVFLDPLLCDTTGGDYSIRESSPCAPEFSKCTTLIGASGIGCVGFPCGDVDCSGGKNMSDAVFLVAFIFGGGKPPLDVSRGDLDCSGSVNVSDVVYLVAYIFGGGPEPCAACP